MTTKRIEELIARYWEGTTTVGEEKELRSFFTSAGDLTDELERWREWFGAKETSADMIPGEDFDNAILSYAMRPRSNSKRRRWLWAACASAAAITVALATYSYLTPTYERSETLSAADLEDYETVKELLYFTGDKLNHAGYILDTGLEKLKVINEYVY